MQVRDLQKKMQHVENDLDITIEKLSQTNLKFDEKDKLYQLAEGETQALNRKLVLLEDELQRSESKLATTTADLSEASTRADDINKAIKVLETKNMIDEERKSCIGRLGVAEPLEPLTFTMKARIQIPTELTYISFEYTKPFREKVTLRF